MSAQKQPKDTIIHMPPAPKPVKQKQQPKVGPRQSVWGAIWWSLATGAGMVYLAAVLCLCAWPIIHFIVKFGFHASLVCSPPYDTALVSSQDYEHPLMNCQHLSISLLKHPASICLT